MMNRPWLLRYASKTRISGTGHSRIAGKSSAALASIRSTFNCGPVSSKRNLSGKAGPSFDSENELVTKLASHATLVQFEGVTIPAVQSAALTSQIGERYPPITRSA